MKQCGRCGAQNLDQQAGCTACGLPLPAAPFGTGTLLIPGPSAATPAGSSSLPFKGTMIGMAPPTFVRPDQPAQSADPAPGAAPSVAAATGRRLGATMIGIAPPLSPAPSESPAATSPVAAGAPRVGSAQKTMLGVARPGIAPLNPGQAKPASTPPPAAKPLTSSAAPSVSLFEPSPKARRRGLGVAALAIAGSAILLAAAVLAFFLVKGRGSVTAKAGLDETGHDLLELACAECPDGTKAWTDSAQATFQAGRAKLKLTAPLKVGENPLVVGIERPSRRREEIALSIPIEYRVRGTTDELAQASPKISVLASALPGTSLVVDGKAVTPDPNGAVRFDFDVERELTGPEAAVKTLERRVPYNVTPPGGISQKGEVQIRIGITPLVLDAPGALIVVGKKEIVIAGRTAPGSILKIGNDEVPLDGAGRFAKRHALASGENPFVVRSTLRDHAPRLLTLMVRRSDNLPREAALARSMAQATYPEVLRAAEGAIGRSVAFQGTLFDLRRDGYSSLILLDVKDGCRPGPCLAKVVYGSDTEAAKGKKLSAYGKIVRFVDGPRTGQRIPEMRAELLLAGDP